MNTSIGRVVIASVVSVQAMALCAATRPSPVPREVVLPAGTNLSVRLADSLNTKRARPGTRFTAHLDSAVAENGGVVLPRGAVCRGHLVESKSSGRLRGRAIMTLTLDSVELNGTRYPVATSAATRVSKDHRRRNLVLIGGGAGAGATIGAIAGGGIGALIGAGAGAAAGTTGALVTGKRSLRLAPETKLRFTLEQPVAVRT